MDIEPAGAADLDLDAYLARIGYDGPRAATADTLAALHRAHAVSVPFENLDILLGAPIRLDLPALEDKLVRRRRGGYCFEQNTLLWAALRRFGFAVTALAARVRVAGGRVVARNHMLLRVDVDGAAFLADVGFGGDGLVEPMPLSPGRCELAGGTFALAADGDALVLRGLGAAAWADLYAFTSEPQHPIDYEQANWYMSTHPQSPFVLTLTAQRAGVDERVILRDRTLLVRRGAAEERSTIASHDELVALLADRFGIALPPGTVLPRPLF